MATDLQRKAKWAEAAIGPAREVLQNSVRGLVDLPGSVSEGAKEVAKLTAWRSAQRYALDPIMEALEFLQGLTDWNKPFLIADSVNFDWRTAPIKQYESFEHFYREELEETWGRWEDLQDTYRKFAKGELSRQQLREKIKASATAAMLARRALAGPDGVATARKSEGGRPPKGETLTEKNVRVYGNAASNRLSVLKRDAPEFAARYHAGEFRTVAAAERAAAGKSDMVEKLLRLWRRATEEERATFRAEIGP